MENQEFIIKIDNNRVFFNSQLSISFEETNLPLNEYLKFKSKVYWKVKLSEFNTLNSELSIEVLDYNSTNIEKFSKQKAKNNPPKLKFNLPFNWEKIDSISYSSNKGKLIELGYIEEITAENYKNPIIERFTNKSSLNQKFSNRKEEKIHILMHLDNAHFKDGMVEFNGNVVLKKMNIELLFHVKNINILEKFDFVKSWFSKKIGVKRWGVDIIVIWIDNEFTIEKATSKDIDRITPELIEGIKYDRTVNLLNNSSVEDSTQELFEVVQKNGTLFCIKNAKNGSKENQENARTLRA